MKISSNFRFFWFIVLTVSIAQMSAEIYLPALPKMTIDLATNPNTIQLTITYFALGFALPGIFTGYASDHIGRKKLLIAGSIIGIIGTYICMNSPSVGVLIIGRFIQASGLGTVSGMGRTIIRNKFSGMKLAQYSSYLSIVTVLSIDMSPFLGGIIEQNFGWRMIFTIIFILAILSFILNLRYKEPPINNKIIWFNLIKAIINLFKDKNYVLYNFIVIMCYATIMPYFAIASFIVEDVLGYSPEFYGTFTISLSLVFIAFSYINTILLRKFKILNILKFGLVLALISGIMLATYGRHYTSIYMFIISIIPLYIGYALIWSNSDSIAYLYIKENVGIASSLANTVRTLSAAVTTLVVSQYDAHSGLTVGLLIIILGIISLIFVLNDRRQNSEFSTS